MRTIVLMLAASLSAQQGETPKSNPPASVTIRVIVDGTAQKFDLKPAAIETLNNLFHAAKLQGAFGDQFLLWLRATVKELSKNENFAPASTKVKMDAVKAAQSDLQTEADSVAAER